jgi:polysaccharide biosynthesis/export protein
MKINNKVIYVLFICLSIKAQDITNFDKEFLDSLPEGVSNDIAMELKENQKPDKKNLKLPSTQITLTETYKRWEQFLENEEAQKSERFGMNLFRSMQSSFMPINEPNFDNNYTLGYGDVLNILIAGQKNKEYTLKIQRDGSILLPEIGNISLSGLSIDDAKKVIFSKTSESLIGSNVFVTLSDVRDIQVMVTGDSKFPGIYTTSGNSNILHLLNISGGINENGSFRKIDLKRDGVVIKTIDLYESIIFGNLNFQYSLRSGDSIYIHPAAKIIRVGNGFNNKGLFELKENETYEDLIYFAGNISRNINSSSVVLSKKNGSIYEVTKVDIDDLKAKIPNNNDSISITEEKINVVEISGEVLNPGVYDVGPDETISSLIKRSGGYTNSAYPFGGQIYREYAKELEKIANKKTYDAFIKYIAVTISKGQGNGQSGASLPLILSELKNTEVLGRVQAEFDLFSLEDSPVNDLFLMNGDKIHIPKINSSVHIYGEVINPGAVLFNSGNSVADYLNNAGGLSKYGDKDHIIIVQPNGTTQLYKMKRIVLNGMLSPDIYPGSFIYVSRNIDKAATFENPTLTAQLFSSLAISLASLNSISN